MGGFACNLSEPFTQNVQQLSITFDFKLSTLKNSMLSFLMESFFQICFEGEWSQNRMRAAEDKLKSLLGVDIQGHQRGGFCIVP